ncbi:hypothetical protein HDU96_002181, partial [Phlyctochytrium bullatum]
MVKWVSNLPDGDHTPYQPIEAEPHIKTVVRYFRPSDYLTIASFGIGFPMLQVAWERASPSIHPRHLPRSMLIQVPFFFTCGFLFACQRSYLRFWGFKENAREVALWESEAHLRPEVDPERKVAWEENDWRVIGELSPFHTPLPPPPGKGRRRRRRRRPPPTGRGGAPPSNPPPPPPFRPFLVAVESVIPHPQAPLPPSANPPNPQRSSALSPPNSRQTMVREDNHCNPASLQPSITISQLHYDKRALSTTDPTALAASLQNLSYLTHVQGHAMAPVLAADGALCILIDLVRSVGRRLRALPPVHPRTGCILNVIDPTDDDAEDGVADPRCRGWHTVTTEQEALERMRRRANPADLDRLTHTYALTILNNLANKGSRLVKERMVDAGLVPVLIEFLEDVVGIIETVRRLQARASSSAAASTAAAAVTPQPNTATNLPPPPSSTANPNPTYASSSSISPAHPPHPSLPHPPPPDPSSVPPPDPPPASPSSTTDNPALSTTASAAAVPAVGTPSPAPAPTPAAAPSTPTPGSA